MGSGGSDRPQSLAAKLEPGGNHPRSSQLAQWRRGPSPSTSLSACLGCTGWPSLGSPGTTHKCIPSTEYNSSWQGGCQGSCPSWSGHAWHLLSPPCAPLSSNLRLALPAQVNHAGRLTRLQPRPGAPHLNPTPASLGQGQCGPCPPLWLALCSPTWHGSGLHCQHLDHETASWGLPASTVCWQTSPAAAADMM